MVCTEIGKGWIWRQAAFCRSLCVNSKNPEYFSLTTSCQVELESNKLLSTPSLSSFRCCLTFRLLEVSGNLLVLVKAFLGTLRAEGKQ